MLAVGAPAGERSLTIDQATSQTKLEPTHFVAIGASAGGLDALSRFLAEVPAASGLAFIFAQHMAATQPNMMAEVLRTRTSMPVLEAFEGMAPEVDHLYINAPGFNLLLKNGVFKLERQIPGAEVGALLFDQLLTSLAVDQGARAIGVVLSGNGSDGALGLHALKQAGGFVVAQDPQDASASGMPLAAIATGDVDLVVPASRIPAALIQWSRHSASSLRADQAPLSDANGEWLHAVLSLVAERTGIDFKHYKTGTLVRRILGRMRLHAARAADEAAYLAFLAADPGECEALAADMLINVTRFFRDKAVFETLAFTVFPDLIAHHDGGGPLRIWIPACSSGEEVWSIAILLHEALERSGKDIPVQLFGSDLDADAINRARAALYPASITADIAPDRIKRYFVAEEGGYRVCAHLRSWVIFAVQNLLFDPPFARVDLLCCRNLLIYFNADAQTKAMALFHFALRPGGVLLLGVSESPGEIEASFELISKPDRVYRRLGGKRNIAFSSASVGGREEEPARAIAAPLRPGGVVEHYRQALVAAFAPACVIANSAGDLLYALGPTDRYLHIGSGLATQNLIVMAPLHVRSQLRAALATLRPGDPAIEIAGGERDSSSGRVPFAIEVRSFKHAETDFIMAAFRDRLPLSAPMTAAPVTQREQALADANSQLKAELLFTLHQLEAARDTHSLERVEAMSLREEYQSTNEELLTSKEELQSLNEELTVLNGQLQDTLEQQRSTSDDLHNVLVSSDIATLVLDLSLQIRFFTPATKSLFGVMAGDVGRPLSHLRSLASDESLLGDVGRVVRSGAASDVEIEAFSGAWFQRKIMPYTTTAGRLQGVVITYTDVSQRHAADAAKVAALRKIELISKAKSRFLAAASHDLRQPLQTLSFLHGLLTETRDDAKREAFLGRMDHTLVSMSAMLNTLLDINQIEAGLMASRQADFALGPLLHELRQEFGHHAEAKGLGLRVVGTSRTIHSDRRLLQQMLRNLLTNAVKYTQTGRVLFGARRSGDTLRIEVWDSGVGLAAADLGQIFEEYFQVEGEERGAGDGMGLGLAIVKRLAELLGHRVSVRSLPGRGSVFAIEVPLALNSKPLPVNTSLQEESRPVLAPPPAFGDILIVDDDPDILRAMSDLLSGSGFSVTVAASYETALSIAAAASRPFEMLIADYNLPHQRTGLEVALGLQAEIPRQMGVIILTGDISVAASQAIHRAGYVQITKPVKAAVLKEAIHKLHMAAQNRAPSPAPDQTLRPDTAILVVDDDRSVRESLEQTLNELGYTVQSFESGEGLLAALQSATEVGAGRCLLLDAYLGGMSGLDVLAALQASRHVLAPVMMTGRSDVATAVAAMKAGAIDYLEKPVKQQTLANAIGNALAWAQTAALRDAQKSDAREKLASLSPRERTIMGLVLDGHPSKNIAADLGINQRTVENHRAAVMNKTGAKSIPALARLAVAAAAD